MTGTTRQTATGVFATSARSTATRIQAQGRETFAETLLRGLGRPGTGVFGPAMPFDFSEPYRVQGDFSLNEKLQLPLSGARNIPIGMPIHRRPGTWLLGQRVAGRKTDFVCYAGKQVEEIELTFADGLPLPNAIKGGAHRHQIFQLPIELYDPQSDVGDPTRVHVESGRPGVCQGDRIRARGAAATCRGQPQSADGFPPAAAPARRE